MPFWPVKKAGNIKLNLDLVVKGSNLLAGVNMHAHWAGACVVTILQ